MAIILGPHVVTWLDELPGNRREWACTCGASGVTHSPEQGALRASVGCPFA